MFDRYDTLTDRLLVFLCYLSILVLVIAMFYPFWDQFVMSISTRQAALVGGFRLWTWPINLDGYRVVLRSKELGTAAMNTLFRVVVGTGFSVVVTSLTAYPLSRRDLPLKRVLTGFFVFTMFFSGGLIPTYMWVRNLGLINNPLVLILPGLAAYYLVIVRNFYTGMPQELQEAAQIDGANDFTLWWKVVMPLSKPILATIALWTAVNHWNAYLDALIYMTDKSKYVLQILLRRVLLDTDLLNMGMQPGQEMGSIVSRPTEETVKAALLIVTTVPILLVYPFAQRYFIQGLLQGSVKG
ncbi:MAG: putative aldouronate transport system permease protein [Chloroflexota bacterium]|nr:putative aldouronate transport system permease protein [Chloroflexota bacterium]